MTTLKLYSVRGSKTAHSSPDCVRLTGAMNHMFEYSIDDLNHRTLCKKCFPDRPKTIKTAHLICTLCEQNTPRPCAHNGGVRVYVREAFKAGRGTQTEDIPLYRRAWVWPENAWKYTLVNPVRRE